MTIMATYSITPANAILLGAEMQSFCFRILFYFSVQATGTKLQTLLARTVDLAIIDLVDDVVRVLAVDCAADRLSRAQDLLHHPGELPGHRPGPHHPGSVDDVVQRDVAAVLDVLDLLPVARRLLQGLDDKGCGRRHHGDGGLPVLDLELDRHLEALPVAGRLGDVVTDLLRGQTQGTHLGGQGRGGTNLATNSSQVDVLYLVGIKLGTHLFQKLRLDALCGETKF